MTEAAGWLGGAYVWVKAAHVIVTFYWVAGLFLLPRYLVHQASVPVGSPEDLNWRERTARARRIILGPALVATWVLGIAVALSYGLAGAGWIHAKIALVLLLSGYQGWISRTARRMAAGERPLGERQLRLWNEVPAAFVILIVGLAILKPF